VSPKTLAVPKISEALARARHAKAFANLELPVRVRTLRVRDYIASVTSQRQEAEAGQPA